MHQRLGESSLPTHPLPPPPLFKLQKYKDPSVARCIATCGGSESVGTFPPETPDKIFGRIHGRAFFGCEERAEGTDHRMEAQTRSMINRARISKRAREQFLVYAGTASAIVRYTELSAIEEILREVRYEEKSVRCADQRCRPRGRGRRGRIEQDVR